MKQVLFSAVALLGVGLFAVPAMADDTAVVTLTCTVDEVLEITGPGNLTFAFDGSEETVSQDFDLNVNSNMGWAIGTPVVTNAGQFATVLSLSFNDTPSGTGDGQVSVNASIENDGTLAPILDHVITVTFTVSGT